MNGEMERRSESMNTLRSRMDADARFHRVVRGYDPEEVQDYLEQLKNVFDQQVKAGKREQEALIAALGAAKSEIEARNCAVKSLSDKVAQREKELSDAAKRITTLVQYVKKYEAEREDVLRARSGLEQLRAQAQRAQTLEEENRQLRAALTKASSAGESWRQEREGITEENERMQSELSRLRAENARLAAERDEARSFAYMAAMESRGESARTEQRTGRTESYPYAQTPPAPAPAPPAAALPAQAAGRLADIFAEAYEIVNQLRGESEPRSDQSSRGAPRMHVIRPDGTTGERGPGGR